MHLNSEKKQYDIRFIANRLQKKQLNRFTVHIKSFIDFSLYKQWLKMEKHLYQIEC